MPSSIIAMPAVAPVGKARGRSIVDTVVDADVSAAAEAAGLA